MSTILFSHERREFNVFVFIPDCQPPVDDVGVKTAMADPNPTRSGALGITDANRQLCDG